MGQTINDSNEQGEIIRFTSEWMPLFAMGNAVLVGLGLCGTASALMQFARFYPDTGPPCAGLFACGFPTLILGCMLIAGTNGAIAAEARSEGLYIEYVWRKSRLVPWSKIYGVSMLPQQWDEYDRPGLLLSCRIRYGLGFFGAVQLLTSGLAAKERDTMAAFIRVIVERANLSPSTTIWGDFYRRDDNAATRDKKE